MRLCMARVVAIDWQATDEIPHSLPPPATVGTSLPICPCNHNSNQAAFWDLRANLWCSYQRFPDREALYITHCLQYLKLQIALAREALRYHPHSNSIRGKLVESKHSCLKFISFEKAMLSRSWTQLKKSHKAARNVSKNNQSLPRVRVIWILKWLDNNSRPQGLTRGTFLHMSQPRDAVSHYKE